MLRFPPQGGVTPQDLAQDVLSLPESYELVVGDTFELFYRGILRVNNPSVYNIYISCAKGSAYKRKYVYTPEAGDVGTIPMTVSVIDDAGRTVSAGSTNLIVVAKPSYIGKVVPVDDGSHNLIDVATIETNKWIHSTLGTVETTQYTTNYCVTDYIAVVPDASYALRESTYKAYSYAYYNSSKEYISAAQYGTIITIPSGVAYIRLCFDGLNSSLTDLVFAKGTVRFTSYIQTYAEFAAAFNDTLNVLCVGDSLTAAGKWVEECYRRLTASDGTPTGDGFAKINFMGTVGVSPCLYEGYGGWTYDLYNSTTSPFYLGGKIDLAAYATSLSAPSIDVVNVLIGWNQTISTEAEIKAAVRTFINNIRSSFPQAVINVFGIEVGDADGMGENYGATWNWYYTLQFVMNLNQWLAEVAAEYEEVYFSQLSGQFDSENNMVQYTRAVNTRNTDTEVRGGNGVHPADEGYLQIADVVYRKMIHTLGLFM